MAARLYSVAVVRELVRRATANTGVLLFGVGLSGAPPGDCASAIDAINAAKRGGVPVWALDIP